MCASFCGSFEPMNQRSTPSSGNIDMYEGRKIENRTLMEERLEKVVEDITKVKNGLKKMKEE